MKATCIMALLALGAGIGLAPREALAPGSGNGAELATYIVDKGKPLLVMVRINRWNRLAIAFRREIGEYQPRAQRIQR